MQNLLARNLGIQSSGNELKRWQAIDIEALDLLPEQRLAIASNLAVMHCLDAQVKQLEAAILEQARLLPAFQGLLSVSGIGKVLALTIACETADDENFARLANDLILSNHQINWAHLQALAWAETMGQ